MNPCTGGGQEQLQLAMAAIKIFPIRTSYDLGRLCAPRERTPDPDPAGRPDRDPSRRSHSIARHDCRGSLAEYAPWHR
jgi:hypothetical protein